MCTTTNRITDKLGKVDWNAVKKVAIGITAVTVSGLVVAATGSSGSIASNGWLRNGDGFRSSYWSYWWSFI